MLDTTAITCQAPFGCACTPLQRFSHQGKIPESRFPSGREMGLRAALPSSPRVGRCRPLSPGHIVSRGRTRAPAAGAGIVLRGPRFLARSKGAAGARDTAPLPFDLRLPERVAASSRPLRPLEASGWTSLGSLIACHAPPRAGARWRRGSLLEHKEEERRYRSMCLDLRAPAR